MNLTVLTNLIYLTYDQIMGRQINAFLKDVDYACAFVLF